MDRETMLLINEAVQWLALIFIFRTLYVHRDGLKASTSAFEAIVRTLVNLTDKVKDIVEKSKEGKP